MKNQIINALGILVGMSILSLSSHVNQDLWFGLRNPLILFIGFGMFSFFMANIEAIFDAHKSLKGEKIQHWTSFYRPLALAVPPALIWNGVDYVIGFTFYNLFVFWLVFDALYNYHVGNHLQYIGKTAVLDKFARLIGFWSYHFIKLLFLFASILLITYKILA